MVKHLDSIEAVILELGGPRAVAQLTQRKAVSAVPMWKNRGSFPRDTYPIMQAALRKQKASAPDSLWKMMEPANAS